MRPNNCFLANKFVFFCVLQWSCPVIVGTICSCQICRWSPPGSSSASHTRWRSSWPWYGGKIPAPCKLFHLFKTNKAKTSRPLWSIFVPQFHVEIKYSKSKDKSKLLIDTKLWAMVGPQALSLRNNNWFLKAICTCIYGSGRDDNV